MNYIRRYFIILFFILSSVIFAQEETDNIDSLFNNPEDILNESTEANTDTKAPKEEIGVIQDLIKKENFKFSTNANIFMGYSQGWDYLPWIQDNYEDPVFTDSALMGMSSKMTFDAQIGDNFRFLQSYTVAYPNYEPGVSEFFADFDFNDLVYLRIGRQNLTWGISRYYPFTNLPARIPDNFGINNSDSLNDNDLFAVKMDIPIGIGGIQGLIYARNGYFSDPAYPSMNEIGWGSYYNLALKQADITIGGFYQKDMNLRGFTSISTTLFDKLELYSEWLVSYDQDNNDKLPLPYDAEIGDEQEEDPDSLDFGANIGFLINLFSDNLEISGEYYYNGEETELEPLGTQFPFFWGHNLGAGISLKMFDNRLKLFSYLKYNLSDNSGVIVPAISYDSFEFMQLTLAMPIIFGSVNGGYAQNNPDPYDRNFSFILTAKISGGI